MMAELVSSDTNSMDNEKGMKFALTVELENDIFKGGNLQHALSEILNDAACNVRSGNLKKRLSDRNGNTIGEHFIDRG